VHYPDYLRELAQKPQALRQVAPELLADMDESYRKLHAMLVARHGELEAAFQVLAKLLGCAHSHGEQAVGAARAAALAEERPGTPRSDTPPTQVTVPPRLAAIHCRHPAAHPRP
jgi:hypothetical protein